MADINKIKILDEEINKYWQELAILSSDKDLMLKEKLDEIDAEKFKFISTHISLRHINIDRLKKQRISELHAYSVALIGDSPKSSGIEMKNRVHHGTIYSIVDCKLGNRTTLNPNSEKEKMIKIQIDDSYGELFTSYTIMSITQLK